MHGFDMTRIQRGMEELDELKRAEEETRQREVQRLLRELSPLNQFKIRAEKLIAQLIACVPVGGTVLTLFQILLAALRS
jgi:hypothetical protein